MPDAHELVASGGFDYAALPPETADTVRQTATRIRRRRDNYILETGRDLDAVKAHLEHGLFGPWLEAEFSMKERTAQNYMSAARLADRKSAIVAVLPPAALYALASPSTPETAQDDVVHRLQAGERIDLDAVKQIIRDTKAAAREAGMSPEQREREAKDRALAAKKEKRKLESREAYLERLRERDRQIRMERIEKARPAAVFLMEHLGEHLPELRRMLEYTFCSWREVFAAVDLVAGEAADAAAEGVH